MADDVALANPLLAPGSKNDHPCNPLLDRRYVVWRFASALIGCIAALITLAVVANSADDDPLSSMLGWAAGLGGLYVSMMLVRAFLSVLRLNPHVVKDLEDRLTSGASPTAGRSATRGASKGYFIGSTMWLSAAHDEDIPFVAFIYSDALVLVRPTWASMTTTNRNTAVRGSLADLASSVMSVFMPWNGQGGPIGRSAFIRQMKQIRAMHDQFTARAGQVRSDVLATEIEMAGWRVISLPTDQVAAWANVRAVRRRRGWGWVTGRRRTQRGSSLRGEWIDILATDGRHYQLGGTPNQRAALAALLSHACGGPRLDEIQKSLGRMDPAIRSMDVAD